MTKNSLKRLFKGRIAMFPRTLRRNMSVWRQTPQAMFNIFSAENAQKLKLEPNFSQCVNLKRAERGLQSFPRFTESACKLVEVWRRSPKVTDHYRDLWKCLSQSESYLASVGINTSCIEGEITINLHSIVGWAFIWVDPVITWHNKIFQ